VLEFNARLGDPEAQVLLPMVDLDFGDLTEALASGTLSKGFARASAAIGASGEKARAALAHAHAREKAALGVVIAGKGYPESTVKGISAEIREDSLDGALVFHASTSRDASGSVLTGGGRSFTVVGMGGSLAEASRKAYRAVDSVRFDGGWHRNDIGAKFMEGKR
jgi:phosphoribosylamine--glycine ligase